MYENITITKQAGEKMYLRALHLRFQAFTYPPKCIPFIECFFPAHNNM
jgi:hypothetical protein